MLPASSDCPDSQTLDHLLAGRLPPAEFRRLESHVAGCGACGAVVAHLALSSVAGRSAAGGTAPADGIPPAFPGDPLPLAFAATTPAQSPAAGTVPADGLPRAFSDGPPFALIDRDRFEIVRQIASGGMGRVVEAWDRRHSRTVALKTLLHPDAAARRRFAREARITGSLQHPGIVPLYETGRWSDDEPFIAMKLVRGRPLDEVVARTARRERLALIPNVIAMTEALAFAHEKGVIHRDLKPANVLLGSFGETVVIDWGIARALGDPGDSQEEEQPRDDAHPLSASAPLTRAGVAMGTPYYMPPEQARGEAVDAGADVYALGALLYHVLAGSPPYSGHSDVIAGVLAGPPEPLGERAPWVPPDLLAIVGKAMSREPGARYADARAMAEDLRRFETGQLVAAHTYTLSTLIGRWIARHRAMVVMAAALVVAVGSTAGFSLRRIVRERDRADAARIEADHERLTAITQRDAADRLVGYLLGELRRRLERLGKLALLGGLGGEVEGYYRTLAPSTGALDVATLRRRAVALELLSSVEWRRRNLTGAATLMRGALDATAAIHAREPDSVESTADLAVAYASLATLLPLADSSRVELTAETGQAEALARAIEARPDVPGWAHAAAGYVDASLADAAVLANQLDRARDLATAARAALARVGDWRALDDTWQDRVALAHFQVASVGFRTQAWPVVIESLGVSVAIRRTEHAVQPDNVVIDDNLAASLRWLGEAYENRYEDRLALSAHREALDIERGLVRRDPENLWMAQELSGTLIALCLLEREWEGPAAAEPRCTDARETAARLSKASPDDRTTRSLVARSLEASGDAALAAHRNVEARGLLEAAVEAARRSLELVPGSAERQIEVADSLHDLGRAEAALGHFDAARARYREALAIEEPGLARAPDASSQVRVGEVWMLLADTERGEEARADYARAVSLFGQAHDADRDDVEPALYLAKASRKLAATERDEKAKSELVRRANEAVAPPLAAGRVSPEWRAELDAAGRL